MKCRINLCVELLGLRTWVAETLTLRDSLEDLPIWEDASDRATAMYYFLKRTYEPTHVVFKLPQLLWATGEKVPISISVIHAQPNTRNLAASVNVFDNKFDSVWVRRGTVAGKAGPSVTALDFREHPRDMAALSPHLCHHLVDRDCASSSGASSSRIVETGLGKEATRRPAWLWEGNCRNIRLLIDRVVVERATLEVTRCSGLANRLALLLRERDRDHRSVFRRHWLAGRILAAAIRLP